MQVTPTAALIDVIVIGAVDQRYLDDVVVVSAPPAWQKGFSFRLVADDSSIREVLAQRMPHVVVTVGQLASFTHLSSMNLEVRRRWTHYEVAPDPHELARHIMVAFVDVTTRNRFPDHPLVSVFTATYRTGPRLYRAYHSLSQQYYDNWEWVVFDDSPDTATFEALTTLASADARVKPFRSWRHCGVIGEVKRRCTGLCSGAILVELDHDDRLTPNCLGDVVSALAQHPDCGFAYSDCAEIFEDGEPAWYGESFAFGFGSYRRETHDAAPYLVTNYPPINARTIRHIVGVPNHVRAWTRQALADAGGYAPDIHVADDYELLIRTFLSTRMVHIQKLGYVQYLSREGANTHRQRNAEIQRLVALFQQRYDAEIHARLVELGVHDHLWTPQGLDWSVPDPGHVPIANYQWP